MGWGPVLVGQKSAWMNSRRCSQAYSGQASAGRRQLRVIRVWLQIRDSSSADSFPFPGNRGRERHFIGVLQIFEGLAGGLPEHAAFNDLTIKHLRLEPVFGRSAALRYFEGRMADRD